MMKSREKYERSSLCGLILVLLVIAGSVAGIVYWFSSHRRRLYEEKWKDYDECGLS